MNLRGLQRLVQRQRRQNGRQPLGQHGFAGAGRADEQHVMAAGGGDFQGALHVLLAFDLGEIQFVVVRLVENFCDVHLRRRDLDFAFQKLRRLAQILHRNDLQPGDDRRFGRVFGGHQHAGLAVGLRAQGDGQNALARTHRAGQRQFADDDEIVELVGFHLFAGGQHAQRDGQIKARPLLLHVGGREVDGGAAHRKFEAGIGERGGDAVARFLDRRVRQADDDDERVAVAGVDLDFDRVGFNAVKRGGTNLGQHKCSCFTSRRPADSFTFAITLNASAT